MLLWTVPMYVCHRTRPLEYSWASCIVYSVFLTWQLDVFLFLTMLVSATTDKSELLSANQHPSSALSAQRRMISSLILPDENNRNHRIHRLQNGESCQRVRPSRLQYVASYAIASRR